jgi:prepilin-type N-terminal cleavage/methylation domain-containing protein
MKRKTRTKRSRAGYRGFTLTEMAAAMLIMTIVVLGMGVTFVDSSKGWTRMYDRAYEGVVGDAFAARRAFDAVVRRSVTDVCRLSADGRSIVVFYYADSGSTAVDRYARFFLQGDELRVEYGVIHSAVALVNEYGHWGAEHYSVSSGITLAQSVTDVNFSVNGACARMILKLDDGTVSMTVSSSANRHNRSN